MEHRPPGHELFMELFGLVNEIMADDVVLAEQLRNSVMAIWLAERRARDARLSPVAWRDMLRGEGQLRRRLCRALREGYLGEDGFERIMTLLSRLRQRLDQSPAIERDPS